MPGCEVQPTVSRLPLASVVASLGLVPPCSELEIAGAMRSLAGLPPHTDDPVLWVHLLDWFTPEVQRPRIHQLSDMGHLAYLASMSAVPPDDAVWTTQRWASELGLP